MNWLFEVLLEIQASLIFKIAFAIFFFWMVCMMLKVIIEAWEMDQKLKGGEIQ